jgi:hypothetical protein
VRQLAAAGFGVREIARGTGLSAATVSRWIRIAGNELLLSALENGRIDLFRAMYLAGIKDPALLNALIELAPHYAPEEFYTVVQQRCVATSNTNSQGKAVDPRKLALLAERLARVQAVTPDAADALRRIVETASALLRQALTIDAKSEPVSATGLSNGLDGPTVSLVNAQHTDDSAIADSSWFRSLQSVGPTSSPTLAVARPFR